MVIKLTNATLVDRCLIGGTTEDGETLNIELTEFYPTNNGWVVKGQWFSRVGCNLEASDSEIWRKLWTEMIQRNLKKKLTLN